MGDERLVDPVVLTLISINLQVLHGVLAVRYALSSWEKRGRPPWPQQLSRWGQAALAWARRLCTRSSDGTEDADCKAYDARAKAMLVANMVHQRRLTLLREAGGAILNALTFFLLFCTAAMLTGFFQPRAPSWRVVLTVSGYLILCICRYCPWEPPLAMLRLFFGSCTLIVGLSVVVHTPDMISFTYGRIAFFTPVRLACSVFVLDTPFIIPLNLASSAMFVTMVFLAAETESDFWVSKAHILGGEILAALTICGLAMAVQESIVTSCRQAVELKASTIESQTTKKVLNAVCDAVVELDERFKVAIADTRMAALLLHGRSCITAGSDFLQYFQGEEERQSFREWLEAPPERSNEEVGYQAKLRDSAGSLIDVEMFCVPFETVTGVPHNFVGIREKATEEHAEMAPKFVGIRQRATETHAEMASSSTRAPTPPVVACTGALSTSDSASASSSFTPMLVSAIEEMASSSARAPTLPPVACATALSTSDCASASSFFTPLSVSAIEEVHEIDSCPVFKFDGSTFKILGYSPGFSIANSQSPRTGSILMEAVPRCEENIDFLRTYLENAQILLRRARASPDPAELSYVTSMLFSPRAESYQFYVDLRIKLNSHWKPDADLEDQQQLPCALGTAIVLAVARRLKRTSAACSHAEPHAHPPPVSL